MSRWVQAVDYIGVGTGTAATQLDGAQNGAASDIIVPTRARTLLAVRPKVSNVTPTANQSVVTSFRLVSTDVIVGDYEILCNPLGAGLGTNETMYCDVSYWYPANMKVSGGQHLQAFGQAQIANSVAPLVGGDLLFSDEAPPGPQAHFKLAGIFSGGGPTAMGTGAASTTAGGTIQINTGRKLFALYGYAVNTTPAASKPIEGLFTWTAPEIGAGTGVPNTQTLAVEPVQGFLGTTTFGDVTYLTKAEGLDIPYTSPTTISTSMFLKTAVTNAGNFSQGVGYF